jgi:hypothetical protein
MPDIARGRRKILTVVAPAVVITLLSAFVGWRHGFVLRPTPGFGALSFPLILAALGALMYRGVHWAREAIVAWFGLIAIAFGLNGIVNILHYPVVGVVALLLCAGFGWDAAQLYRSEDVEAVVNPDAFPTRAPR